MTKRILPPILLFLLLITLPYIMAARLAEPGSVFGGFLLNPQDGASYLAKMYQGWRGDWLFRLPFSAEPGEGVFLFVFYIFLGHAARWSGLSLVAVFHLARILAAVLLLWALHRLYARCVPNPPQSAWAFTAGAFCLGMGWLLLPAGYVPVDFWVAETYPLLSAFTNPHFGLSLALLLALLTLPKADDTPGRGLWKFAAQTVGIGLLLSLLSPFGVVLGGLALTALLASELWEVRPAEPAQDGYGGFDATAARWKDLSLIRMLVVRLGGLALGGGPFLVYYLWVSHSHPQLASWNAQNQTLTPPAWDVWLGLSPFLVLAIVGAVSAWRRPDHGVRLLPIWAVVGLVCIYLPFPLQRRFMMGLHVPLVGSAALGLEALARRNPSLARAAGRAAFLLALPSTIFVLLLGYLGARSADGRLYLEQSEVEALEWIEANTPPEALILAAPEMGLLIPAQTGRRVIYGHPYETVNAAAEKRAVEDFFRSSAPERRLFLAERGVAWIYFGPRELQLGHPPVGLGLKPAFVGGEVTIYQVTGP